MQHLLYELVHSHAWHVQTGNMHKQTCSVGIGSQLKSISDLKQWHKYLHTSQMITTEKRRKTIKRAVGLYDTFKW